VALINVSIQGDFSRTQAYFDKILGGKIYSAVDALAQRGVDALAAHTPASTGLTAALWDYEIEHKRSSFIIRWINRHVDDQGTPIVILLQLGHGTGTGGYVQGRDFINPAIQPIFDEIANAVWKEITS
jgi:hypothetical protein